MLSDIGRRVQGRSESEWGRNGTVHLIGLSEAMCEVQQRAARFAAIDSPVLIAGESGVGKEVFAKALYLLGNRVGRPFLSVNCAQYQNEELLVSELFGHRKGSFTGAGSDRQGLFEAADGGVVFLDEVGELSPRAQAMLLRVLSEGEVRPLGLSSARYVDVRILAASNRPLEELVAARQFREDLLYRLDYLHLYIPPIRAREDDWRLLMTFYLDRANRKYGGSKRFSDAVWPALSVHRWPGNVREIRSMVDVGFCLADADLIAPDVLVDLARRDAPSVNGASTSSPVGAAVDLALSSMVEEEQSFWQVVRAPYLDRELNRSEVREIVRRGLVECGWSYRRLLDLFNLSGDEYLKFMDFLRHHRLKPVTR